MLSALPVMGVWFAYYRTLHPRSTRSGGASGTIRIARDAAGGVVFGVFSVPLEDKRIYPLSEQFSCFVQIALACVYLPFNDDFGHAWLT